MMGKDTAIGQLRRDRRASGRFAGDAERKRNGYAGESQGLESTVGERDALLAQLCATNWRRCR